MANIKPKQSTKQGSWKKYTLIGIVVLVIAAPLGYWGYQKYLDKVDADRFAALQSDFKKLQTEFNKIDPGWEYGESCVGQGGVYSDQYASSCSVGLSNSSLIEHGLEETVEKYKAAALDNDFKVKSEDTFTHNAKEYSEIVLTYNKAGGVNCDLLIQRAIAMNSIESSLGCSHAARKFYFDRLDR